MGPPEGGGSGSPSAAGRRRPRSEDPATGRPELRNEPVGRVYYAVLTPGSVQCGVYRRDSVGAPTASVRGAVGGFSADSRVRLLRRAVSLPWEKAVGPGGMGMVTLTYPAVFPKDGRMVKAHLDAMSARVRRRYGMQKGMWKQEFQQRGAPHFHIFVGLPEDEDLFRAWLLQAWYEVVGSGDEKHLFNGVDISRWRWGTLGQNRAKIGEYFARHGAKGWKSYQNQLPEGYTSPGRWWGVWGGSAGFVPDEQEVVFGSREEYYRFRRLVWTLQEKNRGRQPRKGGRDKGAWTLSVDGMATGQRWAATPGLVPEGRGGCPGSALAGGSGGRADGGS